MLAVRAGDNQLQHIGERQGGQTQRICGHLLRRLLAETSDDRLAAISYARARGGCRGGSSWDRLRVGHSISFGAHQRSARRFSRAMSFQARDCPPSDGVAPSARMGAAAAVLVRLNRKAQLPNVVCEFKARDLYGLLS
jgi:hypothetical protein